MKKLEAPRSKVTNSAVSRGQPSAETTKAYSELLDNVKIGLYSIMI